MTQAFDSSCNLYFMKLAIDLGGVQALLRLLNGHTNKDKQE